MNEFREMVKTCAEAVGGSIQVMEQAHAELQRSPITPADAEAFRVRFLGWFGEILPHTAALQKSLIATAEALEDKP